MDSTNNRDVAVATTLIEEHTAASVTAQSACVGLLIALLVAVLIANAKLSTLVSLEQSKTYVEGCSEAGVK